MKSQVVVFFKRRSDGSRDIQSVNVWGENDVTVEVHANEIEDRATLDGDITTLELLGGVDWILVE